MSRVEENLGLIRKELKKTKYENFTGIDFDKEDLFQEGVLGLIEADKTFKQSKDVRFSTYATKCIRNKLNRYIYTYTRPCRYTEEEKIYLDEPMFEGKELENYNIIPIIEDYTVAHSNILLDYIEKKYDMKNIRLILTMRMEGYTMLDIGEKIGLTKDQVKREIDKMRKMMYRDRKIVGNEIRTDIGKRYKRKSVRR